MALANPTINPPRLPSPTKRDFHSRSPSQSPQRSPVRHYARDFDPLLRDLSPTTTLRAFAVQSPDAEPDFLSKSLETASHSERALGAKAAQACADLRSWARELDQWQWPGTFDVPEPVRKKQRMSGASLLSMRPMSPEDEVSDEEYWGSLPAQMVKAYEGRVEEIHEDMEEIDVEELKEFVLSAHNQAGIGEASIDDSIGTIGAATDLGRLDDFTALITATILQALPYLSRLARLLHTWTIRLAILRAAPAYLRNLRQARQDLDHGWAALAVSPNPASGKFGREMMDEMKGVISNQVQSLGRRLDKFLDELEGREETVPDAWIDDFETLEGNYGEWVVRAERKVHENEWRRAKMSEDDQKEKSGESLLRAEGGLIGRTLSKMTVDSREMPDDRDAVMRPESALKTGQPSEKARPATTNGIAETGAQEADEQPSNVTRSQSSSPTKRTRHQPITIDFDEAGEKLASEENLTALPPNPVIATQREPSPAVDTGAEQESVPNVKKRAAFLNRDIESSNQLNRSKPPPIVRPFEHASNAFTRLFKRDLQQSQSPSSDTGESEKESKSVRRKSFGRRSIKDRVVSNKENVRPNAEKMTYGDLTALPTGRKSEESRRGRQLSRDGTRTLVESTPQDKSVYSDLVALPKSEERRSRPRTPKAIVPATYQPTTLGSPFREADPEEQKGGQDFEFPENWPLSESATPQDALSPTDENQDEEIARAFGPVLHPHRVSADDARRPVAQASENDYDELRLHKSAPETDALEEMFVQSIPNSPSSSRPGSRRSAKPLHRNRPSRDSHTTKSSIFSLEELKKRSLEIERYQKQNQLDSSLPTGIPTVEEETSPAAGTPPQSPSELLINENAIFGSSPRSNNRGSRISRSSMPLGSPELAKLQIPDRNVEASEATLLQDVSNGKDAPEMVRRASVQSIESHPRSELRSVDITPRSPMSPRGEMGSPIEPIAEDAPQTPEDSRSSPVAGPSSPMTPLGPRGSLDFPSPPSVPVRTSSLNASPESGRKSSHRRRSTEAASSDVLTDDYDLAAAPLSRPRSKRKYKDVPLINTETTPSPNATKSKPTREGRLTPGAGDNFDRHVSEVLDRVHAPIRFKSRPGAETPQPPSSTPASSRPEVGGKAKSYSRLQQPKLERQTTKSMTLAPADASPKKGSAAAEPEVKLYHLTQSGRSEPIKLFVRLVGEGERVMVRVGGGWADLADYLRQYAEHHGSRTVSEGMLEVQTASAGAGASANVPPGQRRTFSTPSVAPASEQQKSTPAPSARGPLDRASTTIGAGAGGVHDPASMERPSWLNDPQPRFTMGESEESDSYPADTPVTPTLSSSRPGTANGGGGGSKIPLSTSRPQSRQTNNELGSSPAAAASFGMAGPSGGAGGKELPEQKARWVEGMLAKAKESASAEKGEKFSELGRVGGTRRVVFREGGK